MNEPAGPQPGDPLPRRDAPRTAAGLPRRGDPVTDSEQTDWTLPRRGEPAPEPDPASQPLPQRGAAPDDAGRSRWTLPRRGEPAPRPDPSNGSLPQRAGGSGGAGPLPQRGGASDGAQPLPQRFGSDAGVPPLPRRTNRTRPPGRHRSPHRLSVSSDAPALVLAVPGSAAADTAGIGPSVAATAELSCPGVDIRVGYLEGDEASLSEYLASRDEPTDHDQLPSVVVPLLLSPSLRLDPAIQRLTGDAAIPAVLAAHLGPHPLVAEALHSRLADAGLVRHSRASGLSISSDGRGIVVLADVGEEATGAAAVAAVLLASRLSVPVVPASLGDPASIVTAVDRLTESGAGRPALAPCLIGPETSISVLDDLSAALGAPCAAALGSHQAIGQLVAIRYGAALASLSLAG
jgi:hypothetical protein